MLLSACMIVKNESRTLAKCLGSLKDVADEVVVVDTGSTDDTMAIAESFGAKVFAFEWDNDFSHARNESLRHAQGDWILIVDADEYLDEQQKKGLRGFLEGTDAEGVFVTQKNYIGSLSHIDKVMPIRVMRLFRRGHEYVGAIHEQIAYSVEQTGRPVATFDLDLHHVGYTSEFVKGKSKAERNISLLEKELQQEPDNLFHRSNLVAEYVLGGEFAKAAELAERTFRILNRVPNSKWPNFAPRIMMHWISSLWNIGEREHAMARAEEGIKYFPWYTDLKKVYANMKAEVTQWADAERVLMECRAQGDASNTLIEVTEGSGTYLAALDLGYVWSWLGDDMVARKWYLQSFLENPTLEMPMLPLMALMPPDAAFLRENIESRIINALVHFNYAETYAIRGIDDANELIDRVEAQWGESEQTQRARMSLLAQHAPDGMKRYVEQHPYEFNWYLLGLYQLETQGIDVAVEALAQGGVRGEYIAKTYDLLSTTSSSKWGVEKVARDLAAMRTSKLLREWLPYATDTRAAWIYLKYSPLGHILTEIEWPGESVYQCEQNALRCFRAKKFPEAKFWLEKAKTFTSTVTQVLLSCDLALADNDVAAARKIVYEGKKKFPASEAIKNASNIVHPKVNPLQLVNSQGRFAQ